MFLKEGKMHVHWNFYLNYKKIYYNSFELRKKMPIIGLI